MLKSVNQMPNDHDHLVIISHRIKKTKKKKNSPHQEQRKEGKNRRGRIKINYDCNKQHTLDANEMLWNGME